MENKEIDVKAGEMKKPAVKAKPAAGKAGAAPAKKKKLTKKQINQIHAWVRFAIQLAFFIFLPSAYSSAFAGVKYMFTRLGAGEEIAMTAFIKVLLLLLIYTVVFGRFFCGYACAFGSLGDWVYTFAHWIAKKRKKKIPALPEKLRDILPIFKYSVLAAILILCFLGLYGQMTGTSPWDVFSMLHSFVFHFEKYGIGIVLFVLILVGMAFEERFFCKFCCPMGAIFSMMPVLTPFSLRRNRPACLKKCSACTNVCPSKIGLPNDGALAVEGDCFMCGKCVGICPKTNIHCGVVKIQGNEYWFTAVRAVLLAVLMVVIGV